jgi:hypothetical protein
LRHADAPDDPEERARYGQHCQPGDEFSEEFDEEGDLYVSPDDIFGLRGSGGHDVRFLVGNEIPDFEVLGRLEDSDKIAYFGRDGLGVEMFDDVCGLAAVKGDDNGGFQLRVGFLILFSCTDFHFFDFVLPPLKHLLEAEILSLPFRLGVRKLRILLHFEHPGRKQFLLFVNVVVEAFQFLVEDLSFGE